MVRGATDKEANDIQARPLWPEIWKDMSAGSKRKAKQKWAIEKPKLDNASKLRGTYFIDPLDKEFKETIKKTRRKLEVPMPAAMSCKTRGREYREPVAPRVFARQNTHAPLKPTNLRESVWKGLYVKIMKITLQGK